MESNLLTDQNMPGYGIDVAQATESAEDRGWIQGVGIPASGTKCLFATWSGTFEPQGESQLTELKGIDQIQGRLVNPLPYEIRKPCCSITTGLQLAFAVATRRRDIHYL